MPGWGRTRKLTKCGKAGGESGPCADELIHRGVNTAKPINVEWLQERVTDLEVVVARLQMELKTASDSELLALRNNEGLRKIIADQKEALRRVVEALTKQ